MPSTSAELDLFGNPIKVAHRAEEKPEPVVVRKPEVPGLNAPYDCIKLSKLESVIWNRKPAYSAGASHESVYLAAEAARLAEVPGE